MTRYDRHSDLQHTLHLIQPYRAARWVWLTVASSLLLTVAMLLGGLEPGTMKIESTFHLWYKAGANLVVFAALYAYIFSIVRVRFAKIVARRLTGMGGVAVISGLLALVSFWTEGTIFSNTSYNLTVSLIYYLTAGAIAYLVVLLMTSITEYQQTIVEMEHMQADNAAIRYETLERQSSPHFLFNSLNTLDGLIGTDDARAHTYLHQLANIFRYSMQKAKVVTLQDELAFARSYVFMMQIRYGDNLVVEEHIDPTKLENYVVPISLQLLIENCIKHNVVSNRHPLRITIRTTDRSSLVVSNPLQPKQDIEQSHGIGLSNLQQRYHLLFDRDINIVRSETLFEVEIPLAASLAEIKYTEE